MPVLKGTDAALVEIEQSGKERSPALPRGGRSRDELRIRRAIQHMNDSCVSTQRGSLLPHARSAKSLAKGRAYV